MDDETRAEINERLKSLDALIDRHEAESERIRKFFEDFESNLVSKVGSNSDRLDAFDKKLNDLDAKVENVKEKMDKLISGIDTLKWVVAFGISIGILVAHILGLLL